MRLSSGKLACRKRHPIARVIFTLITLVLGLCILASKLEEKWSIQVRPLRTVTKVSELYQIYQ
jgi:hypothetical protein